MSRIVVGQPRLARNLQDRNPIQRVHKLQHRLIRALETNPQRRNIRPTEGYQLPSNIAQLIPDQTDA